MYTSNVIIHINNNKCKCQQINKKNLYKFIEIPTNS